MIVTKVPNGYVDEASKSELGEELKRLIQLVHAYRAISKEVLGKDCASHHFKAQEQSADSNAAKFLDDSKGRFRVQD